MSIYTKIRKERARTEIYGILAENMRISVSEMDAILAKHGIRRDPEALQRAYRLSVGQRMNFTDTSGKPHLMTIRDIQPPDERGLAMVRYVLDSEIMRTEVEVSPPTGAAASSGPVMAQKDNPFQVAAPSNGDLWVMYVKPGDLVAAGQELFNISIMKQEKAVNAAVDGLVKKVFKRADFRVTKQMVPVRAGELIVELAPLPHFCNNCRKALPIDELSFCPYCGSEVPS